MKLHTKHANESVWPTEDTCQKYTNETQPVNGVAQNKVNRQNTKKQSNCKKQKDSQEDRLYRHLEFKRRFGNGLGHVYRTHDRHREFRMLAKSP